MSAFYHAALAQALQIHTCDVSCYILGSSATSNSAGRYQGLLLEHCWMWYLDSLSRYKWVNNRTQVKKSHNIRKNTPQVAVHPFLLYYLCFTQCVRASCSHALTSQEATSWCCLMPLLNTVRLCVPLIHCAPSSHLSGSVSVKLQMYIAFLLSLTNGQS